MNIQKVRRVVASIGTAIVLVTIAAGFVALRSPAEERVRRFDERRVADLRSLAASVDLFFTRRSKLPASLEELESALGPGLSRADPATRQPYTYRPLGDRRYELCALFDRASPGPVRGEFWSHREGEHCFPLDIQNVTPGK